MSAYLTAIHATGGCIDRRAKYFRNQIVVVIAITVVVTATAVAMRAVAIVLAWLLLVPACGLFIFADCLALRAWRRALLTAWVAHEIDCEVLRQTLLANPALPKATVEGMLESLPAAGSLVAEQRLLTPTRRAIATVSLAMHDARADALMMKALGSAVMVGVLLAAVWTGAWVPLVGLAILTLMPAVGAWRASRRRVRVEAEVAACRTQMGFNDEDYGRMRAALG